MSKVGDVLYEQIEILSRSAATEAIRDFRMSMDRDGIFGIDAADALLAALHDNIKEKNSLELTNGQIIDSIGELCVMRQVAMIVEARRKQDAERN